jgi:hypothetical protein
MAIKNLKGNEYFVSTKDEVPVDFTITISGQYMADKEECVSHDKIVHILYDDRFNMGEALYGGDFTMNVPSEFIKSSGKWTEE